MNVIGEVKTTTSHRTASLDRVTIQLPTHMEGLFTSMYIETDVGFVKPGDRVHVIVLKEEQLP